VGGILVSLLRSLHYLVLSVPINILLLRSQAPLSLSGKTNSVVLCAISEIPQSYIEKILFLTDSVGLRFGSTSLLSPAPLATSHAVHFANILASGFGQGLTKVY